MVSAAVTEVISEGCSLQPEFVQSLLQCSTVLAGVIHERFYWHPAKPGGAAERDFVFAEQFQRDELGGFQRDVAALVELAAAMRSAGS
jgi:hypothetical protein